LENLYYLWVTAQDKQIMKKKRKALDKSLIKKQILLIDKKVQKEKMTSLMQPLGF